MFGFLIKIHRLFTFIFSNNTAPKKNPSSGSRRKGQNYNQISKIVEKIFLWNIQGDDRAQKKYHHELTAHDGIGLTSNVSVRTNCQRLLARERPETHSELRRVVCEMFLVGISFLIVCGAKIGFFSSTRPSNIRLKDFLYVQKKRRPCRALLAK